ncbi:MAG: TIGR02302 family protein [Alphaproteobacteria bacterium]
MTPEPTSPAAQPRRLSLLVAFARTALMWERLWPAAWPTVGIAGLFIAVALLDVLPVLPGWLHGLLLVAFAAAMVATVILAATRLRWPSRQQARRRLERDSGLSHRPLEMLEDSPVAGTGDPDSMRLWALHRERVRTQIARLRLRLPRAGLATVDPVALRAALGLVLVIALVAGYHDWSERLGRALRPDMAVFAAVVPANLDVWVNPPAYTGLPPLFLTATAGKQETLTIATGSTVLAQVQGGRGVPALLAGDNRTEFSSIAVDAYKVSTEVTAGDRLAVVQDETILAEWPLILLPDEAPRIEFLAPPARSERAALRLDYSAQDDYGLDSILARIQRLDDPSVPPLDIELALPGAELRQADGTSYHDLTPHPWAGLAVTIQLIAKDGIGQSGESDAVRTVLPERIFNHPIARALVELRKQLTLNPAGRLPVARSLSDIYGRPDHYFNDTVVALALRSAERRLIYDAAPEAVPQVQQLLWDTALHLEEGDLAVAERDLREVQKALMEALARGADDAEIERLMDELQQALDRFLEALAEHMRDQMAGGAEPQPLPPDTQMLPSDALQQMIDRAREMARSGARDAARDMLAQLQNMLENLRASPFSPGMDENSRNAFEMLQDMESLMREQQELLDNSYRRSLKRGPSGKDRSTESRQNTKDAETQDQLRRQLGEMMRRLAEALGEIPRPLGRAEQSMRDARDALQNGRPGDAVQPQTRTMDQLQQGMQSMAQQFMEQMGEAAERNMGQMGVRPGNGQDPLGRRPGGSGIEALEGVEIPDRMELRRAREILDELRRRRGDRQRPALELDYIDRLLRQF